MKFGMSGLIALACGIVSYFSVTSSALAGADFTWVGGAGDGNWTTPENWQLRSGSEPTSATYPQQGDNIWVDEVRLSIDLSNSENLAVLTSVATLHLSAKGSRFDVKVPQDSDIPIPTPIFGGTGASGVVSAGQVLVTGSGTVRLKAKGECDYTVGTLVVDGAELWFPQDQDLGDSQYVIGELTVTNGSALHLPTCHNGGKNSGNNYIDIRKLFGDGMVVASEDSQVRFSQTGGDFSGKMLGPISIFMSGRQYLSGTESTINLRAPRTYNGKATWATGTGVLGIMKFGMAEDGASSIGTSSTFDCDVNGGGYLYLGSGEDTDKYFRPYANDKGYSVIDGGAVGGLGFTGMGGVLAEIGTVANSVIVGLSGSNTTACVFRGRYNEGSDRNGNQYLVTTVKKGTGTWRFDDPAKEGLAVRDYRNFRGTISVDEGCLQFDTVAPIGEYCSVGLASVLKSPTLSSDWASLPNVDWAFSLGGNNVTETKLSEGTLEYTGASAGLCDDRRVRLEADARLRANGTKRIRYRLAASTSARSKTLTLDGSSMATNEVHDIVDDATHKVSVVKEGCGTWLLGGEKSFHGDLTVKEGKLIVREYPSDANYTWYRYTVKHLFDSVNGGSKSGASVRFLGLYDEDGVCQTTGIVSSEGMVAASIEAGQAGYGTCRTHTRGAYSSAENDDISKLFGRSGVFDVVLKDAADKGWVYPQLDKPETWIPLVVRLPEGAATVKSYDWATTYGWSTASKTGFKWMPCRWSLEGSVDGIHWENVNPEGGDYVITTNDYPAVANDSTFVKTNTKFTTSDTSAHLGGWSIRGMVTNSYTVLDNVGTVSVAIGAMLEIENAQAEIGSLRVDARNGGGTIRGAKFAAEGEIDFIGYEEDIKSVAILLEGAMDTDNIANWSVRIGGVVKPAWRTAYMNGELKIIKPGLSIIVR